MSIHTTKGKIKTRNDIKLLRLHREEAELQKKLRNAPVRKLKKPIQQGFIRTFDLRDDTANREDAHVFREILKVIQNPLICKREDFVTKKKGEAAIPIGQKLKAIPVNNWEATKLPESYKKHFGKVKVNTRFYTGEEWVFRHPWMYTLVIKPHMLTHVKETLPEIEARLKEIRNHIQTHNKQPRLNTLHGCRSDHDGRRKPDPLLELSTGTED